MLAYTGKFILIFMSGNHKSGHLIQVACLIEVTCDYDSIFFTVCLILSAQLFH